MQNLIKFHQSLYKILSGNGILTISKCHKAVVNRKCICNTPNLDLFKVNASAKVDHISSIRSEDVQRNRNFDDNQRPRYKFAAIDA